MKRQSILILAMLLVCFAIDSARADLMIDLPNTGEAGIGNVETNYALSYAPNLEDTPVAMAAYGTEFVHWVDAPAGSEWIKPNSKNQGYYFYELSLDIPGITSISGRWASDNNSEIFLNGASTGFTRELWGFLSLEDFTITSGFTGHDSLVFRVWEEGNTINGLLVTDLTATVVPVPSAVVLGIIGIGCAGWRLKRKSRE